MGTKLGFSLARGIFYVPDAGQIVVYVHDVREYLKTVPEDTRFSREVLDAMSDEALAGVAAFSAAHRVWEDKPEKLECWHCDFGDEGPHYHFARKEEENEEG